jgi:hypothetical protein
MMVDFPFKLTERDLDHLILEEFHSSPDFPTWFGAQIGLPHSHFLEAKHSVVDTALGRSG